MVTSVYKYAQLCCVWQPPAHHLEAVVFKINNSDSHVINCQNYQFRLESAIDC